MPSEIVVPPDRRQRKRDQRRDALLDLAADLVEERGVAGLSMAALAEAADYATASLYTYFPSRSALVAALQTRALDVLRAVGEAHLAATDAVLVSNQVDLPTAALARLWAFADLFLTAPTHHAREFHLQQELLIAPELEEGDASPAVIAAAMAVLELPRRLLAAAAGAGALDAPAEVRNTAGAPVDGSMARTFAWVAAMNGALLLDRLTVGPPMSGAALGREQTRSLLTGWGALPALLATAEGLAGGAAAERPARRKVRT